MLPITAVLAFICLAAPFINMFSVSNRSQKSIFDRYIVSDFETLPPEDQSSLAGAYYYLAGNAAGNALLADAAPEKIDTIKASGKIGIAEIDQNMYIYYEFPLLDADISGFDRMSLVSTDTIADDAEKPSSYNKEQIAFYDTEGNTVLTADISKFINACVSAWSANPGGTPDISPEIDLPDGSVLRIYHCSFSFEPEDVISYMDLNAVLCSAE